MQFKFAALAAVVLLLACTVAASTTADREKPEDCDFDAAVLACKPKVTGAGRCDYFKCLIQYCPTDTSMEVARWFCYKSPSSLEPHPDASRPLVSAESLRREDTAGAADGSDEKHFDTVSESNQRAIRNGRTSMSEEEKSVKRILESRRMKESASLQNFTLKPAASPCHGKQNDWSKSKAQQLLHGAAWAGYLQRDHEHYTESSPARWSGIDEKVCPRHAPPTSDCSSFVTWVYWTVFGLGPDFVNEESWKAGYTGSMVKHGHNVDMNDLKVGDLCFYYSPMHHVAIVASPGDATSAMVVSHGYDPVQYAKVDYPGLNNLDYCRRYIVTPPAPPKPEGCTIHQRDLCSGNNNCLCTLDEHCGGDDEEHKRDPSRFRNSAGGCAGTCRNVVHNECKGNDLCLKSEGVC